MAGILAIQKGVTKRLTAMLENARDESIRGFLNRVAYPIYQNHQQMRWASENASEGSSWPQLNPKYGAYKLRRYGGGARFKWVGGQGENRPWVQAGNWPEFPGGGRKMMIATGRLVTSVTGRDIGSPAGMSEHRKVVTDRSLIVSTTTPYSDDANKQRDFTTFGAAFYAEIGDALHAYISGGES